MRPTRILRLRPVMAALGTFSAAALAPLVAAEPHWLYTLLPGSQLVDDCKCGRPASTYALYGTFRLRLTDENPVFSSYAVSEVMFHAGYGNETFQVSGDGEYRVGGEVALVQELTLTLTIATPTGSRTATLTNERRELNRPWPMFSVQVGEVQPAPLQFYRMDVVAAPLRELWFATASGMTPGVGAPLPKYIHGGELVSSAGRVVRPVETLLAAFNLVPHPEPSRLRLDAVDVLPRGEIAFSLDSDANSETLGPLHHGDVLTDQGRILATGASLIGAFGPQPPITDVGLDALQVMDDGEIWFSTTTGFFSEKLGRGIGPGDLLSSRGTVIRSIDALLSRFQPPPIPEDWGLDALHVWPSGEIWFSVEQGFISSVQGPIMRGDLVSDQGYVVFRNLDLVAPFQPLEDLADFGLGALWLVTDTTPPPNPAPLVTQGAFDASAPPQWTMTWEGPGRVFQVERAFHSAGPYLPAGPISTDQELTDPDPQGTSPTAFYRVRQW